MRTIISLIIGIITLLTGLRFAMLALGANPGNDLVAWIYNVSAPLVSPFAGIFGQPTTVPEGLAVESIIEWSSLVALLVYSTLGSLLMRVVGGRHA